MSSPLKAIKGLFDSFAGLFFPRHCGVCGEPLSEGEKLLCTSCIWEMPLTYFWREEHNPLWDRLSALVPVKNASALFFYHKMSGYDRLIHGFKYYGRFRVCYELGLWFGNELRSSGLYEGVDLIIPVPLHPLRRISRGYNQSEYFARGLSRKMGVKVSTGNVVRHKYNRSQTSRSNSGRWENVSGIFSVRRPSALEGKHILLVDDVLTTGATVESCIKAIIAAVPGCTVSVASIATSPRESLPAPVNEALR